MKEAVRFYDPVHSRVEMIPITQELKKSVRTAYSHTKNDFKEKGRRKKRERKKQKEGKKSERAQKERKVDAEEGMFHKK